MEPQLGDIATNKFTTAHPREVGKIKDGMIWLRTPKRGRLLGPFPKTNYTYARPEADHA